MTTFQIPEGKVVDSIEFKSGEKAAVLNIRYKEERQKEKKKAFVVVSTEQPTCVYLDLSKNKLTPNFPNFSARDHIPVRLAEEGEFVVLSHDACQEALRELSELCAILRSIENGNCATEETFRQIAILSRRARALQVFIATEGK